MANPRQRKKSRAGNKGKPSAPALRRIHNKQNRAPALRGPEALQAQWDKRKTVFQNYAALGLLPSIPLPGSKARELPAPRYATAQDGAEEAGPVPAAGGFGQIIRDAEGNVIDIILPEEDAPAGEDEDAQPAPVEAKTDIVRTLEGISAQDKPVQRHTSTSEREWLTQLVRAHGEDTAAMARDRKLNVWQKTPGELRKMLRKAGGVDKLKARGGDVEMA